MRYEIIYDYMDEMGNEERNIRDIFEGSWDELQREIKAMRNSDYIYNISANAIEEG